MQWSQTLVTHSHEQNAHFLQKKVGLHEAAAPMVCVDVHGVIQPIPLNALSHQAFVTLTKLC